MDRYKIKLPKKIKARWLKDLRSGKFEQTRGQLCDLSGYCCLGVLATQWYTTRDNSPIRRGVSLFGGDSRFNKVPKSVVAALSQPPVREKVRKREFTDLQQVLMKLNDDDQKTFKQIADFIEKRL